MPLKLCSAKAQNNSLSIFKLYDRYNYKYRTRAIITRGLYIFNPLFEGQKSFFKEVFSENFAYVWLVFKSGF